jgi:hypothetical protein
LEQTNTIETKASGLKLGITNKELGVFLLLLFITLKLVSIIITHNRSFAIDLIVYFLLIVTFNYANWTYESLFKTGLVIGIYTLINFSSYKLNALMPLLIVQSVSGIRFKRYLAINFIISGIFLLVMFIVYGEGYNMSGYNYIVDRKIRMSFGFNHPNVAALHYFCFMINGLLLVYYSKYKKHLSLYLLLIIPLWLYIYKMTASRSFILTLFALYAAYGYYLFGLFIYKKNIVRIIGYAVILLPFLFSSITLYLSINREKYIMLDRLLSKRLTFYNWFLDTLKPIDIFFGADTYKKFVIDSSYLHLLFEGGIFFFLGFCVFYVLATINMINKKEWIPILVIMSFMVYGLMESMLLYGILIGTNLFWVLLYYHYKNGKMRL